MNTGRTRNMSVRWPSFTCKFKLSSLVFQSKAFWSLIKIRKWFNLLKKISIPL